MTSAQLNDSEIVQRYIPDILDIFAGSNNITYGRKSQFNENVFVFIYHLFLFSKNRKV